MHNITGYAINSTGCRKPCGYQEQITLIQVVFSFPINEYGDNDIVIPGPSFEVFNGEHTATDAGAAADLLDDFVSLGYDIRVLYNPTLDEEAPRLTITAEATPEKILIL